MSVIAAVFALQAAALPLDQIETYKRDAYDRMVTQCDRLAAHYDDPEAVTDGVGRSEMDTEAAIEACRAAVAADPDNPRLNYQLARAYGYSGQHEAGQPYRDAALAAGYPQSLFVVGYIRVTGWDGRGADPCYGGELIRRSAHAGRYAGLVGFPHYALQGAFEGCEAYPEIDTAEMLGFLETAGERADGFYQGLLVEQLTTRVEMMDAQ